LFESDAYQRTFKATVLSRRTFEGKRAIVLDRTLFYPESGGQPSDTGSLGGNTVVDVREEGDVILHVMDELPQEGEAVEGLIDWDRRFDHMQQHSGQHILSQSFLQVADAHTRGFHLGTVFSTLDLNKDIDPVDIEGVEHLANRIITENRPVIIHQVSRDELNQYPVRREVIAEGPVRLVEIEGFECTGCCGTHVKQTGDIGLIKVLKAERYKGGTRISFLCGMRALADFQLKHSILDDICRRLSVSEKDLRPRLEKMEEEHKQTNRKLKTAMKELALFESRQMVENASRIGVFYMITRCFHDRDMGDVLTMLKELIKNDSFIVLFGIEGVEPALVFGRSMDVELDLRPFFQSATEAIDGKGGGSPSLVQGRGRKSGAIQSVLDDVRNHIENVLSTGR